MDPITLALIGIGKYVLTHGGFHTTVSAATAAAVGTATVGAIGISVIAIGYLAYSRVVNSLQARAANKSQANYIAFGAAITGDIRSGNAKEVNANIWGKHSGTKQYVTGFVNKHTGETVDVEIIECRELGPELKNIHRTDPVVIYN